MSQIQDLRQHHLHLHRRVYVLHRLYELMILVMNFRGYMMNIRG